MPKIIAKDNESVDDVLRRFKRDVARSGNLAEYRKREYYLKPSEVRKQKKRNNRAKKR